MSKGEKHDAGKIKAGVLEDFSLALLEVARVGSYGADKYARGNFLELDNAVIRYTDAMWRHLLEGNTIDAESGINNEVHFVWNALARLEIKLRKSRNG